jgi:outer membrane protein assembly factor BamB
MNNRKIYLFIIICQVLASSFVQAQQPIIDSLSSQTLTRSGRLIIFGKNFGSSMVGNQVIIGGHNAIISRWNTNKIVAYVPEDAGPGNVNVKIVTSAGSSNEVQLNVTLRSTNGRVKWVFEADVDNLWFRPAVSSDGTIYIHGSEGYVYALKPDGGLKWIHQVNWYAYVPPAVGPNGVVYVGSIKKITAINPDGTERWSFTDESAQGVKCGAAIGPNGNIYLANDLGIGAYSLSSTGRLLWNNPGNPQLTWYGSTGAETVLGPKTSGGPIEQMYVVAEPRQSTWTLQAFSLSNGSQIFSIPISGQHDPLSQQQTQPAVGPDGTIYITHFRSNLGWVLEAYSPTNGQSLWYYFGNTVSGLTPPDVGSDGIVYYTQDRARLIAFNPNTRTPRWIYQDGTVLNYPTVSPNNDLVVVGGVKTFGDVGFIKGISCSSGRLQWTITLPGSFYPEPRVVPIHRPRFSSDGKTVYVSTTILGGSSSNPHSFLYAITAGDTLTNVSSSSTLPYEFQLSQNYPNPFNSKTKINWKSPISGHHTLKVYDMLGREVATLVNDFKEAGVYEVEFDGSIDSEITSGVYFYQLKIVGSASMEKSYIETKKMILLK